MKTLILGALLFSGCITNPEMTTLVIDENNKPVVQYQFIGHKAIIQIGNATPFIGEMNVPLYTSPLIVPAIESMPSKLKDIYFTPGQTFISTEVCCLIRIVSVHDLVDCEIEISDHTIVLEIKNVENLKRTVSSGFTVRDKE